MLISTAGLFILLSLMDFDPRESLYFTTGMLNPVDHFLGKPGSLISSFLVYFMGVSSFVLSAVLLYLGCLAIKKISPYKKAGLALAAIFLLVSFMPLFALKTHPGKYNGGGVLGEVFISQLSGSIKKEIIFVTFSLSIMGLMVVLFRKPAVRLYNYMDYFFGFMDKNAQFKQKTTFLIGSSGRREKTESNNEQGVADRESSARYKTTPQKKLNIQKTIKAVFLNKSSAKPPLVQKVFLDQYGNPVEPTEQDQNKKDFRSTVPVENQAGGEGADGQYYLPYSDEQSSGASKPPSSQSSSELNKTSYAPQTDILVKSRPANKKQREKETTKKARELERTLSEFGIQAKVTATTRGPVITRYELQPAPGVKLSRIVNLSDNIALSLSANGVRIEAPIPGRSAVGIEIPNEEREMVTLGDIIEKQSQKGELPLLLGKDIAGNVITSDLTFMPHLLIAGATGSGKSVCLNSLIVNLLYQKKPHQVKFIMIDPKMVELKIYNGIPHLLTEVVTDPRDAAKALRWVLREMENRYGMLDDFYVRDIRGYNAKSQQKMPYIVVIVDEFSNLMAISQKEVEDAVVRLAAMSRAVGIHLIMATQRPSVDVITGLIKANFPYRIAFQVASKTDSRTILDAAGAEKLLGRGDMLFSPAGNMNIWRIQGAYVSEEEVLKVVTDLKKHYTQDETQDILCFEEDEKMDVDYDDPIYDQAVEVVLRTKRASASFLQRRLKIGYNRAARIIELMEEKGVIGPPRGSKPREIYMDGTD